jgi:hypothetical protein
MRPTAFTLTLLLLAALAIGARLTTRITSAATHDEPVQVTATAN